MISELNALRHWKRTPRPIESLSRKFTRNVVGIEHADKITAGVEGRNILRGDGQRTTGRIDLRKLVSRFAKSGKSPRRR